MGTPQVVTDALHSIAHSDESAKSSKSSGEPDTEYDYERWTSYCGTVLATMEVRSGFFPFSPFLFLARVFLGGTRRTRPGVL